MIRVDVLEADISLYLNRNVTFTKGRFYFGRLSKTGDMYVIRSDEGQWVPIIHYKWAVMKSNLLDKFTKRSDFYVKNRKFLNVVVDYSCLSRCRN